LSHLACISDDYAYFIKCNVIALSSHFSARQAEKNLPFQTIFLPHLYSFLEPTDYINYMSEESLPVRVAIFASGQGTNAHEIIRYFRRPENKVLGRKVEISLIVCNKPGAGVLDIATRLQIPVLLIEKEKFFRGSHYLEEFESRNISFIVLAGFLWKIPPELIHYYPERILNIHPALLPKYGGKGMYGNAIHEAVIAARERESGISIHYVDEFYDHGNLFFQANFNLSHGETAETLAKKIHELEYKHYPEQIARWMECKLSLNP
jgi:phosphoribosylglycinamide formyltransferase 1